MTTIATDGKSMAADTWCTGNECFHTNVNKLYRASDGAILGHAGSAFDSPMFYEWHEHGGIGPLDAAENFEAIALLPDGRILCINAKGRRFFHEAPAAIGSGAPFAYAVMDFGGSAKDGVEIAMKRDPQSGGKCQVEVIAPRRGVRFK